MKRKIFSLVDELLAAAEKSGLERELQERALEMALKLSRAEHVQSGVAAIHSADAKSFREYLVALKPPISGILP